MQGLRNLVREIATLLRQRPDNEAVAINATGGHKAQTSFAGLIGQVFRVPIDYQFESFPIAIELPPLPVSFDFDQCLAYRHVFDALDEGDAGELLRADDARLKSFLPELHVLLECNQGLVILNALETLDHEGFQDRFRAQADRLAPKPSGLSPEDKKILYGDRNPGKHKGLADRLERLRQAS